MAAPVALLAQGYRAIFSEELDCETLHAAFHILANSTQTKDVNFSLNRYDMVIIDDASLVSPESFEIVAAMLNRINPRPVVHIASFLFQQNSIKVSSTGLQIVF